MRIVRVVLAVIGILLLVAFLAIWVVPPNMDWTRYRGTIAAEAGRLLGADVAIAGPVSLSLLPEAQLTADDVTIAGGALTARQLRLRASLWPLLAGRVVPRSVVLHAPSLRLPWPPSLPVRAAPRSASLTIEDGTLTVGSAAFDRIDAVIDTAADGAIAVKGRARYDRHEFTANAALTAVGPDRASGLDLAADALYGAWGGASVAFTGQVAADGTASGRLVVHGDDLGVTGLVPHVSFRAEGHVTYADGLLAADDLQSEIGRQPIRAAVALRVLPDARIDVALTASQLDLQPWLGPLSSPAALPFPASLDVSAEAASAAGVSLRRLRLGLDFIPGAVTLRDAEADLPDNASVSLSGTLVEGAFSGRGNLQAPDFPATLGWASRTWLGADLGGIAPPSASVSARVQWLAGALSLDDIAGTAEGAVTGHVRVDAEGGPPHVTADLVFDRLTLMLPRAPPTALPLAADLHLSVAHAEAGGEELNAFAADLDGDTDGIELTRLAFSWRGAAVALQGRLASGGRIEALHVSAKAPDAAALAGLVPGLPAALGPALGPALGHDALSLEARAHGTWPALEAVGSFGLGDLDALIDGRFDLGARTAHGSLALSHPDAADLLSAASGADLGWLGTGPLNARATVDLSPRQLALEDASVTAGALKAAGHLAAGVDQPPRLTGRIEAATLPLPPVAWHASAPLPLDWLRGWEAVIDLAADRVTQAGAVIVRQFAARLGVAGGVVGLGGISGQLAGGALSGGVSLDGAADPPKLSVDMSLAGAQVAGPATGLPFDLVSGRAGIQVRLSAAGYSPAAMLASLGGHAGLDAQDGVLRGIGLPALRAGLKNAEAAHPDRLQASLQSALRDGQTPFASLHISADLADGVATIAEGALDAPDGTARIGGTAALPTGSLDISVRLHPALAGGPELGLHLTGPAAAPDRIPEIAPALRWLARS